MVLSFLLTHHLHYLSSFWGALYYEGLLVDNYLALLAVLDEVKMTGR
jgi:hypothetical protein